MKQTKDESMAVISFASPKGGVGKSTSALLLGLTFAQEGLRVALVDADPNGPLTAWARRSATRVPENVTVVAAAMSADISDIIETLHAGEHDYVIVDLEGTASANVTTAIQMSDLTLIPLSDSQLEADAAADALMLVRRASRALRRPLPHAVLFTRMPPAERIRSTAYRQCRAGLEEEGIPIIEAVIPLRKEFKTIFEEGGTLQTLDPQRHAKLANAVESVNRYAAAVHSFLMASTVEREGQAA